MKILSIENVRELVAKHGLENYLRDLMVQIKSDFTRWNEFEKIPRPAMHVPGGVLELMPVADQTYYTFKYVNCHPKNTKDGLMTVVATGQVARVDTGYPTMVSEMTILTALRTAATAAIATDLMSRKESKVLALIGNGAQSEFLTTAINLVRPLTEVRCFDIDEQATDKFINNMQNVGFKITKCNDAKEAVEGADIITTCIAERAHVDVVLDSWVKEGVHINGMGGDSEGKTELDFNTVKRARIVVEYFDQSVIEGEIQRFNSVDEARTHVYAELHELINGSKKGRENEKEITLYDSVGIGLEDYSVLLLTASLAEKYKIGEEINLVPGMDDPKDLFSLIK